MHRLFSSAFVQSSMSTYKQTSNHCLCCVTGPVSLEVVLDRSAYCCGEQIKLKCDVQNGGNQAVSLICRLIQVNISYPTGVLGYCFYNCVRLVYGAVPEIIRVCVCVYVCVFYRTSNIGLIKDPSDCARRSRIR